MDKPKGYLMFDFDGVLVLSLAAWLRTLERVSGPIAHDYFLKQFESNPYEVQADDNAYPWAPTPDYMAAYRSELNGMRPAPGMAELIQKFADSYKISVISSTDSEVIREFLKTHELGSQVPDVLGYDVHTSKVKKVRMILDKYSAPAERCVFITDTLGDIREAAEVGVKSIAVDWGFHPAETLERGSPLAIARTPSELEAEIENYFHGLPSDH